MLMHLISKALSYSMLTKGSRSFTRMPIVGSGTVFQTKLMVVTFSNLDRFLGDSL